MLALSAATVAAFRAGATDGLDELALWGPIGLGALVASILLLGNPEEPGSGDRRGSSS